MGGGGGGDVKTHSMCIAVSPVCTFVKVTCSQNGTNNLVRATRVYNTQKEVDVQACSTKK